MTDSIDLIIGMGTIQGIKGIWLSENNDPLYIPMYISMKIIHWEFLHLEIWQKWREHVIDILKKFLFHKGSAPILPYG